MSEKHEMTAISEKVHRYFGTGDDRRRIEEALLVRNVALPLSARVAYLTAFPAHDCCLYVAFDVSGNPVGAVGVERSLSRALPGHTIWRIRQIDPAAPLHVTVAVLSAVLQDARADTRTLRVHADVLSRDLDARAPIARFLSEIGATRLASPREHELTLVLDLFPGVESIWSSAKMATVRRKVRAVEKGGLEVRLLMDETLIPRMEVLLGETFARTSGKTKILDLAGAMRIGKISPAASRIVGLFRPEVLGPESLVAFAWASRNGDHVCYDVGASTSDAEARRFPLAYALFWDLIQWAAREGAEWFDLGGVTEGSRESGDRLGGISDYKRHFSSDVVPIREEWMLEPHRMRATLARALSAAAIAGGRALSWFSRRSE